MKELLGIDNQGDYAWYYRNNCWETRMVQNRKENHYVKIYKPVLQFWTYSDTEQATSGVALGYV